ncbi:peptide/nickel transport system ATP-binding protein [Amaricoccus macauensis]|uniref:Peptide/nickel transport system ATP-binding protein n=1 Tax=Amaricoccus macauensis TaxID=57001 RepID=A0A840SPU4_9RHOB|nr:ABC transporter ATP-binding protein [Amaricoccus macauensis]MBB5221866.1 peptide/nickel transport system ATP-binding protein [Amaricoccus macauensis]
MEDRVAARPPDAPLIEIRNLAIHFRTRQHQFRALSGVNLTVGRGEAVGLVGESGSGKSITWLAALGLLGPRARVSGEVLLDGRDLLGLDETAITGVRGREIAMIFQDASSSLNPLRTIGSQIRESLRHHWGMDRNTAHAEAKRLLDRVQIPFAAQRLKDYPHQLSGGMNQRVMIAIALAGRPRLLVADEPTTALDATVQAQILDLLDELRRDTGMALALISHDFGVVAENCDRVVVLYAGRVMENAQNSEIFIRPAHPYTRGLLAAIPDSAGERTRPIRGSVPEPWSPPPGCVFEPRCDFARPECRAAQPPLASPAGATAMHRSACLRRDEMATATARQEMVAS